MGKLQKYEYALSELKAAPFDGTGLLVVTGYLVKMLAAWPNVTTWVEDSGGGGDLHLAWEMTRFDAKDWANLAHVAEEAIWKNWRGLAKANLIYPDGTLPSKVHSFLLTRADELLDMSGANHDKEPDNSLH